MIDFKIIAAMSLNRVIGCRQRLPWHLPEELQWFRQMTLNQTLLMGRKTFESMGKRPLPQRTTYVLTHHKTGLQGVQEITLLDELPAQLKTVWVCGGASIYEHLLPKASELILSVIQCTIDGDAFFPPFESRFQQVAVLKRTDDFEVQKWVAKP
ncbi:MAG: dihydrofolate reductase [Opitutales bacterium]|nr:dihydrofolate reductase [Opitutales bacterium]